MSFAACQTAAAQAGLCIRGGLHPRPDHKAPEGCRTLLLLGPDEPLFWDIFQAAPEATDGAPHPMDRWSKRVIGGLAEAWGGTAIFPYDGPPYAPFLQWARDSGQSFPSPTGLLVHGVAGLWISYRGAVALPQMLDLPATTASPCETCADKPCQTACPVGALSAGAPYDVAACQAHLRTAQGVECRDGGCLVRRACPVSQAFGRRGAQSAFHMAAFVKD